MYLEARWVEEGGMMAYGTDPIDCAAIFVDKILRFFGACAPKKWPFGQLRIEAERL